MRVYNVKALASIDQKYNGRKDLSSLPIVSITTDSILHVVGDLEVVGGAEGRVQQCCVVSKPHCQHPLSVTRHHPAAVREHPHCCHCSLVTLRQILFHYPWAKDYSLW